MKSTHILNISKKLLIIAVFMQSLVLAVLLNGAVFADPLTTSVTCSDSTVVQATRTGSVFTDNDYTTACGTHGYTPQSTSNSQSTVGTNNLDPADGTFTAPKNKCGSGSKVVDVSFNFGCVGPAYGKELNPITDIAFAIFRFLSAGVGLVVIGSIVVAGIQYSASRGNPQATEASIKRITNAIIGLLVYLFMFAIANYLVPGGMF